MVTDASFSRRQLFLPREGGGGTVLACNFNTKMIKKLGMCKTASK